MVNNMQTISFQVLRKGIRFFLAARPLTGGWGGKGLATKKK